MATIPDTKFPESPFRKLYHKMFSGNTGGESAADADKQFYQVVPQDSGYGLDYLKELIGRLMGY